MSQEFDFIEWVQRRQRRSDRVLLPAGDDLAALNTAEQRTILIGADQVLDGVHFDSTRHAPQRIGRKAMNRNLSDCAAMAVLPLAATLTLALPRGVDVEFVRSLYLGVESAGLAFDCPIVGGDTGSWGGPLAVSVAILGILGVSDSGEPIGPIRRDGGAAGNALYVTGALGGSILGRHLDFLPRIGEAQAIARSAQVSAMIDLSDGLSRDVAHLCRNGEMGVELWAEQIPIHPDVAQMHDGRAPLSHALDDGEDYELLFAAMPAYAGPGIQIGRLTSEPGRWLIENGVRRRLEPGGWEHRW